MWMVFRKAVAILMSQHPQKVVPRRLGRASGTDQDEPDVDDSDDEEDGGGGGGDLDRDRRPPTHTGVGLRSLPTKLRFLRMPLPLDSWLPSLSRTAFEADDRLNEKNGMFCFYGVVFFVFLFASLLACL